MLIQNFSSVWWNNVVKTSEYLWVGTLTGGTSGLIVLVVWLVFEDSLYDLKAPAALLLGPGGPGPTHFRPGPTLRHSISFHSSCSFNKQPEERFEWKLLNQSAASTPRVVPARRLHRHQQVIQWNEWQWSASFSSKQWMWQTQTIANTKRKHDK